MEFYNLRGGKERIFDDMNNGFGWARLPKSFMAENTVFLRLFNKNTDLITNCFFVNRLGRVRFVKKIHKKKALLKVAFWNEDTPAITTCRSRRFVTDIESKWVYSHIKLSSNFRYVLI